ncbi:hypothetical protein I553_1900 [Mycobacterium xenopi 4042]|uniref:Uncharacterized protein n=1 Tax=Mycobacterium xenopi 4042 TaxID=1299334 RepID=X8DJA7_MYCXE|nr:hypothetical protein I553_1900 [Mycobacterium xenopi 4042]
MAHHRLGADPAAEPLRKPHRGGLLACRRRGARRRAQPPSTTATAATAESIAFDAFSTSTTLDGSAGVHGPDLSSRTLSSSSSSTSRTSICWLLINTTCRPWARACSSSVRSSRWVTKSSQRASMISSSPRRAARSVAARR